MCQFTRVFFTSLNSSIIAINGDQVMDPKDKIKGFVELPPRSNSFIFSPEGILLSVGLGAGFPGAALAPAWTKNLK